MLSTKKVEFNLLAFNWPRTVSLPNAKFELADVVILPVGLLARFTSVAPLSGKRREER